MKTLAEADCGFASLVLQESTDGWELTGSTSTPLTSALDIGREIHNSMGSWDIGLGAIFSEIGPKGKSDDLLTLGIRLNNRYITTSWYQGSDGLAPVVDLPSDFSMARAYQPDWQPWTHQELPESPLWPWLITKNELTRSLSKVLKSHELALISADGFDEWVWRFAQNAKGSGTLNPEPIDIQEILAVIASSGPNIVSTIIGNELYSKMQLDLLKSHFEALVIKGTHQIRDPWPTADLWNSPSGGGVWELYSKERLLDRTIAIYSAALKIYKSIVMRWFDTMRQRFLFNARLPATFIGRLEPGVKNIGPEVYPGLIMQTHSLKADEQSTIEFEIGARQEIHENWAIEWDQEIDSLRLLRPDKASWIYPLYQSTILDVFGSRPATKIAHEWLWRDLSRLGWVDSVG